MINEEQVMKLRERLQKARGNFVHFTVSEIPESNLKRPDKTIVNGYFALQFGQIHEERWSTVNPSGVEEILIQLFHFDQAYNVERMSSDEAKILTNQIFDVLPQASRYYTYGIRVNGFGGVISFISGNQVGLIGVFDED